MRSFDIVLVATYMITLVQSFPTPENGAIGLQPLNDLVIIGENSDPASLRSKRAINILKQFFPQVSQNIDQDVTNQDQDEGGIKISGSENNEVKVPYEDVDTAANEAVESELTPLEDIEVSEDENRNKRSGAEHGNNGGSGNFLFDIIRLIAGSGSSLSSSSPTDNHCTNCDAAKHEHDEAVPGPATRFLVIANRGLSNLIQDLILRIAATSERFVNFKARLITSII